MIADGRDLEKSVDYAAYAELDSPLRLAASLDAESYPPGGPMRVSAMLRDRDRPVLGATLSAELAGAVTGTVPLLDDGRHGDGLPQDGVYAGTLPAPAAGGYYPVTVKARSGGLFGSPFEGAQFSSPVDSSPGGSGRTTRETAAGEPEDFARGVSAFAVVSPESGRLTGRYAGQREDVDGDGRVDRLVVDVGVETRKAGDFAVAVRLSQDGREVARAVLPVHLAKGSQSVAVPFPASGLRAGAVEGPIDVDEVILMDTSGAAIAVDRAEKVHRLPAVAVLDSEEGT
jgi:hypothetical protein